MLAACSSDGSSKGTDDEVASTGPLGAPSTDVTADPAAPETPLLDEVLAMRDADGELPLDGALRAFSALYGDLPGAEAPTLDAEGLRGTTVARWLAAHDDELTSEQRLAVDAAMSPRRLDGTPLAADGAPAGRSGFRSTAAPAARVHAAPRDDERGCFGGTFVFADAPDAGRYRSLVQQALSELSALLGPLDIPVYTAFSSFEGVNADLNPWSPDCGQPAQACQIRLAPLALQMTDRNLVKTLAHELTHCYQARAVGADTMVGLPDWLIEGFPSWVGETVGVRRGSTAPNYWWDKWFKHPSRPLYSRTYDALGFYAVVEQAGGDPAGRYLAALRTTESSAAFAHLVAPVREHLASIWGATHVRELERGLFWDLDGPGVTAYRPALSPSIVTNGGGHSSALGEAEAAANRYLLRAEVVTVELRGDVHGRTSFAGQADEPVDGPQRWCTLGVPCVCPAGSSRPGEIVEQAPGEELVLGAASLAAGGELHVTGTTLDDFCGPVSEDTSAPPAPEPDTPLDRCLVGTWQSRSWTLAAPAGTGLDLTGGAGATMSIAADGRVTLDFAPMAPMDGPIQQRQTGGATQRITATAGTVDELETSDVPLGPGVFLLWRDHTRYDCGSDSFTMVNPNEVAGGVVEIVFDRQR